MTPSSPNPDQPQTRYEVLYHDSETWRLCYDPFVFIKNATVLNRLADLSLLAFRDPQGVVWRVEPTHEFGPSDYGIALQRGDEWKPTKMSAWLPWAPQSEAVEVYGEECVLFYRRPAHLVKCDAPTFNQPQPESEVKPDSGLIDWLSSQDVLSLEWTTPNGVQVRMTIDPIPKQGTGITLRQAITQEIK